MVRIDAVEKGSLAERAGIAPGDELLSIDSHPIRDVLDYRFFLTERRIALSLSRGGERFETVIEKGRYDDIGLEFSSFLMDRKRSCANRCIFCFVDQNPCGMRETVYFKDDDTRLSFLQGNYVTLTNVGDAELERLVSMHLSPINVSVHTTDPALREKMLGNPKAGKILSQLRLLKEGGLSLNVQLVLCRGINDGQALIRSIRDLEEFLPELQSIAVVPAGLTRHREGLFKLSGYDKKSAAAVVAIVEAEAARLLEKTGSRVVFCSDEFYLLAEREMPAEEDYEGYPQLDNGVGLLRSAETEMTEELEVLVSSGEIENLCKKELTLTLATGVAAAPMLRRVCEKIEGAAPNLHLTVEAVTNRFFGESVTVAGLLCGSDYLSHFEGRAPEILLIPAVSLRHDRDLFLDGLSPADLEARLSCRVLPVENGTALFDALAGLVEE